MVVFLLVSNVILLVTLFVLTRRLKGMNREVGTLLVRNRENVRKTARLTHAVFRFNNQIDRMKTGPALLHEPKLDDLMAEMDVAAQEAWHEVSSQRKQDDNGLQHGSPVSPLDDGRVLRL
jgi:hypothetical protein